MSFTKKNNKYGQKYLGRAKKFAIDAIKTTSKILIQKTAEETGDLIRNKIADKITSFLTNLQSTHKMMILVMK